MPIDFSQPIDRYEVGEITAEQFRKKYMLPNKPVVIRGLLKGEPAYTKWTMDYFRKELGDLEVGIFDDIPEKVDRSYKAPDEYLRFEDYLNLIEREPTNKRIFLFNIFKHKPELRNDFKFPDINRGWVKQLPFTFFGGAHSIVRIHQDMDMSNVFLTQFHGKKRVVLFPPDQSELLYRFPFGVHSQVDVDHPDYEKFPALNYVKGQSTIMEMGDTLFIPSAWWHHIEYLEGGFAMSLRSLSPRWSTRFLGLWKVGVATHIDDLFRKLFGKKWFHWKNKTAFKRANKAMSEIQNA